MLPLCGATASAEGFARTAVSAGLTTGLVNAISFGCEHPAICGDGYRQLAAALNREDTVFRQKLREYLSGGMPYPRARVAAIRARYGQDLDLSLLDTPNNLLAFEYLRAMDALGADWELFPIKRRGSYHDMDQEPRTVPESGIVPAEEPGFSSASACRRILLAEPGYGLERLIAGRQIPADAGDILRRYLSDTPLLWENDFSEMLHYALLMGRLEGFSDYPDCGVDLSARICKALPQYEDFSGFCDWLKNKSVSRARISRVLTHILLGLQEAETLISPEGTLPYLRVLGFQSSAGPLLHELKLRAHAPVITRVPEAFQLLDEPSLFYFRQDLTGAEIYRSRAKSYPDDHRRKVEIW
jgi:predicted nucleotidyltransferase